jgi:Tol biopolymer transport system component
MGGAGPHLLYEHAAVPAISRDGQSIAFVGSNVKTGEIAQEVCVGGIDGESPRTLATAEPHSLMSPAWSPDSRWIAYVRFWKTAQGSDTSDIEVRPAGGGDAKTLVSGSRFPKSSSLCYVTGIPAPCLRWLPDWRLVFSARQAADSPSGHESYSLWDVRTEPTTAEAAAKPERLVQWSDSGPQGLTITADGKRLSFQKTRAWEDVYLGELAPGGTDMKPPRRFTLDNRGSEPNGWTHDSKAVIFQSKRNGRSEIFRQGVKENMPEAIVQGPEDDQDAVLSPNGSWILYVESIAVRPGLSPSPERLMRRSVAGGSPERVLEEPAGMSWQYGCPLRPPSPCVLSQKEGSDLVFSSLDPVRGKGEPLGKIEASAATAGWNLSPNGSCLAVVGNEKYEGRIEVLTLRDRAWHEVPLEPGWGRLESIAWAADEATFFATSWLPDSFNLLHVTLNGKVKPLLRNAHRQWMINPLPSPDGKFLAYQAETSDSNVWLLENF